MMHYCSYSHPAVYKVFRISPTFTSCSINVTHTLMHHNYHPVT